jgi:hypothetical protein
MEQNEDSSVRISKACLFSTCYIARESATVTVLIRDSKAGRGGERFLVLVDKGKDLDIPL